MRPHLIIAGLLALTAGSVTPTVWAEEPESVTLTLRDHRFEPAEIQAPADKKFKLVVNNEDAAPEEFESKRLKREKIVPAKGKIVMLMGPLKPGVYEFFGEYHEATAKGRLVVK